MSVSSFTWTDPIYGQITFNDPTIIRIIQTPIFQRLKSIAQNGLYGLIQVKKINNGHYPTRFEHSLGTAFLCQLLNAPIEVQIFALLHDLYHTNFSHDTDYLSNELFEKKFCQKGGSGGHVPHNELESFHEINKENFFKEMNEMSELIEILSEKTIQWKTFFDKSLMPHSSIVKSKVLGADNIDYILRDGHSHQLIPVDWITQFLTTLKIVDDQIVCSSQIHCQQMLTYSLTVDQQIYNGATTKGFNLITSQILKWSLSKQIITKKQLFYDYYTDQQLWDQIIHSNDSTIIQLFNQLNRLGFYYSSEKLTPEDATIKVNLSMRWRFLNPPFLNETNQIVHLQTPCQITQANWNLYQKA